MAMQPTDTQLEWYQETREEWNARAKQIRRATRTISGEKGTWDEVKATTEEWSDGTKCHVNASGHEWTYIKTDGTRVEADSHHDGSEYSNAWDWIANNQDAYDAIPTEPMTDGEYAEWDRVTEYSKDQAENADMN